jgi:glutathione S-transferase
MLTHLKVPFELKLIDIDAKEVKSEDFLAINPRGQIPVLVLDDNSVLTESLAIINQRLGQTSHLAGERTGITDIYLSMLLTWYPDQSKLYETHSNLQRALENTLALEGVREVFSENELI